MGLPARLLDTVRRTTSGRVDRLPAVRWLSLPQLVRTAGDVSRASSFAKYADKREAMATCPREFYELPAPAGDALWVDYVADTGDGFDATFAMARSISGGAGHIGPDRADLLVFGGDEVYPVASARQYELRLNGVLRLAAQLDGVQDLPPVVALPGNHDWYDGLAAFRRNFCESWVSRLGTAEGEVVPVPAPAMRDDVGGWGAFQSRSYFAVRLTPRWWLWAVDGQLDAPIDAEQLAYFRAAKQHLGDAKIVLCTATPSWLEADAGGGLPSYSATEDTPLYTMLWFVDRVLGEAERHRVRLVLTGDQHHYARYTAVGADDGFDPDLVTSGGGGAFLASTHHLPERLSIVLQPWPNGSGAVTDYRLATSYPTADRSRQIGRTRFLSAAWRNGPSLPLLVGAIDFLLYLAAMAHWPSGYWQAWQFWLPLAIVAVALTGYAYTGGATARPRRLRGWPRTLGLGLLHTVLHAAVAVAVIPALLLLGASGWTDLAGLPRIADAVAALLAVALGSAVFATYLFVADVVGYHTLEAFSGMRIEDAKGHLRLRVTDDEITVHVLGIDTAPKASRIEDLRDVRPVVHIVETFAVPWAAPVPQEQAVAQA